MSFSDTPRDWYWQAEDGRVFSSARSVVVDVSDADFIAWKALGNTATRWPRDNAGGQTDAALAEVLLPYDIPISIKAYAAKVRWGKVANGITYNGHPIDTDDASRANIVAEALTATVLGGSFVTAWKCSDGAWMSVPNATAMTTFAVAVRDYISACFVLEASLGAATTKEDVDNASWPSNALTG